MTTERELVRAVLADPDSDAARRAFGEFMKARPYPAGDPPRGELVDVQLALAERHRAHDWASSWIPLDKRAGELLEQSGYRWREPLEKLAEEGLVPQPDPTKFSFEFCRGFVEHVEMDARAFAEHAPRVFAAAPIRFLTLTGVQDHPRVLASPHLAQIACLVMIDQGIDDNAIHLLAASPHARRLRWLGIPSNAITSRGLDAICASPHLRNLLYCVCSGNDFKDPTDQFGSEGEVIVSTWRTAFGAELERRFGLQPWLHAPWFFNLAYPPNFEAAADSLPAPAEEYDKIKIEMW
jgi:hypothetical protein